MKLVIFVNGMMCAFIGALMLVPAVVDHAGAGPFLIGAFLVMVTGALVAVASSGSSMDGFRARHAFVLTTTVWMTGVASAAVPFLAAGMTPADAFFEAMSGLTTTGATVLSGLDAMPRGILTWRAMLQWIGGIGIIVTSIAVLPFLRVGGMQLFRTESSDKADKELASAARFALATMWIYLGFSVACAVAYRAFGMSGFDAVTHAMTTVATGGFANYDASMGHFTSPAIQWTAVVFMISGSLPFVWYVRILGRGRVRSEQVGIYLGSLAVIVLGMAAWLALVRDEALGEALRLAAFNVVSVVTTTGFATADFTAWGAAPMAVFFILLFFGGCTGSTSGGLKAMRLIIAIKALLAAIERIHSPHRVSMVRFEGRRVSDDTLGSVIAFCSFFLASFAALAVALGMLGLDLETSLSGAATAIANVGPGIGPIIGPAGSFASLPDAAKWVITAGMLLGRLEVMTVLVLVNLALIRP